MSLKLKLMGGKLQEIRFAQMSGLYWAIEIRYKNVCNCLKYDANWSSRMQKGNLQLGVRLS